VGGSAFLSSRKAVASLWRKAASETAHRVTQRSLRFLEPAVPYLLFTSQLAAQGKLEPQEREQALDYFRAALLANPSFTWASWAGADGAYLAAWRAQPGGGPGAIQATLREVQGVDGQGRPLTRWRDFAPAAGGGWRVLKDVAEPYDPRTRGWYQAGAQAQGPTWVEPFLFQSHQQAGFMCVLAQRAGAEVKGVFAVEFETQDLSTFLSTLKVGEHGKVYLVTTSGLVVGHPDGQVTEQEGGALRIARAASHPDPMLRAAWDAWKKRGGGARSFAVETYLAMAEPFPAESGIDWVALGVAPSQDFFGEARAQALFALVLGFFVMVLAAALGALLATRVAGGLHELVDELDRIGRYQLSQEKLLTAPSPVREVNTMADAIDRMKASLRSFARYVPTQLVQDLLETGEESKLGGHKQELTTLFSDLEGFTTLSEQMEPDQLVDALQDYFAGMSEVVRACGGTVDKFIGDAIMAFWNAPRPEEDHALLACRAALAMRARMLSIQREWRKAGRPVIAARIGINTGTALVGNIGSQQRMNYTAMGDPVNLASRLEGLNKVYGTKILLGETTARAVQGSMVLRPVDWVAVKGRAQAVLVHELIGEKGKVSPEVVRACELQREALELYRSRRFLEAAERFEAAGALITGDGAEEATTHGQVKSDEASRVLATRCRDYAARPPPPEWSGAQVMAEK
jgi:adenylate cyclase